MGKVVGIETREIAGQELQLFVIAFDRDRMTLRVPIGKVAHAGLRRLSTRKVMENADQAEGPRAHQKTMWSRRPGAQPRSTPEIRSRSPRSCAICTRTGQPDQSFSERQIYEAAFDRLACELAALEASTRKRRRKSWKLSAA